MNLTNLTFADFSREISLRIDYSYISYTKEILETGSYSFQELFDIVKEVDNNFLVNNFLYAEIGDTNNKNEVFPKLLNFSERVNDLNNEPLYKKIESNNIMKCQINDIIISKVRPNLKKILFIDEDKKDIYFTSAFICLRPKKMSKILFYALRTIFLEDILALSRMGKGYPTISENDLKDLKFNKEIIHKLQENEEMLLSKIIKIEEDISNLKLTRTDGVEVINNTFRSIFRLDYDSFDELKDKKIFTTNFESLSGDNDLRFSFKFQHPVRTHIENDLDNITEKRIKDYTAIPVMTGKSISPINYMESSEYRYVGMSDIKSWYLNFEKMKHVTEEYFKSNYKKRPRGFVDDYTTTIQIGDILMSRSGEGSIGKVGYVDQTSNAIFSDFIMRIRLENYNSKFAYYFFRTEYFQYLIHLYKKGLGNNTNIFPVVLEYFPLPDISIDEQNEVVDNIDKLLQSNRDIEQKINELNDRIEDHIFSLI